MRAATITSAILLAGAMAWAPILRANPAADPPAEASHHGEVGVYATAQGRTMNLRSRDLGWSDDPRAPAGAIEAGYGWRRDRASALLGYEQPDPGRQGLATPDIDRETKFGVRPDGGGVLGAAFVLR
jgi:hypothetical protein